MPARPERIRIVLQSGDAQAAQNLEARHVRQVEVEQNDVVVVQLAEIDPFFTEIGGVDVEARGFEHQFDRLRGGAIVFNQQYAHAGPLPRGRLKVGTAVSPKRVELSDITVTLVTDG